MHPTIAPMPKCRRPGGCVVRTHDIPVFLAHRIHRTTTGRLTLAVKAASFTHVPQDYDLLRSSLVLSWSQAAGFDHFRLPGAAKSFLRGLS
jgi:hypothetical protein